MMASQSIQSITGMQNHHTSTSTYEPTYPCNHLSHFRQVFLTFHVHIIILIIIAAVTFSRCCSDFLQLFLQGDLWHDLLPSGCALCSNRESFLLNPSPFGT